MSIERLEEIQQSDLIQAISDGFLFGKDGLKTENIFRDVEWLIQQVERLEKENKRYREALEKIAFKQFNVEPKRVMVKLQSIARKALESEK